MLPFYILLALAISSAIAILVVRSIINAALSLIVCVLSIAGLFILLEAEFLAVVQVLVYAGGILLLIIFGIMITRQQENQSTRRVWPALIITAILTGLLWTGLEQVTKPIEVAQNMPAKQIGISLMTTYALPFEASGLLLLVSMIGAMVTSSTRRHS
jgi:NADH-quinone oxidoreductase subunit J